MPDTHKMPYFIKHDLNMSQTEVDFIETNCTGAARRGAKVGKYQGEARIEWGIRFENLEDMALFKLKFTKARIAA